MNTTLQNWEKQAVRLYPPSLPTAVFPARVDHPTDICANLCDICCPPITTKPTPTATSPLWTPSAPKAPAPELTFRTIDALANGSHTPAVPLRPTLGGSTLILPPTPDSHRRLALFAEVHRRRTIAERAAPAIAELEAPGDLLDLIISTKTQLAQLEATQLAAINELSTKYPGYYEFLPTEVAMALRTTDKVAQELLDLGYYLPKRYPKTWAQLQAGNIRAELGKIVHQHLQNVPDDIAAQVDELLGPQLATLRSGQVTRLIIKIILQLNPDGAEDRLKKRRADRHVYRYAGIDGMAHMGFYSTTADINIIFEGLTAAAETAWTPGDKRTNNQRRIDTIVDLMRHTLDTDILPASIHQIPPAPSIVDEPDSAGSSAGIDADPDTGAVAGAVISAETGTETGRPPTGTNVPCTECGHDPAAIPEFNDTSKARRGSNRSAKYSIGVLIPMNTLLGGNDPAYITGQGWITPHQARILATDHTWRRILIDPVTEKILDIGRKRYRPPAAIAEFVRTRDQYCVAPGCTTEAKNCALDHMQPFKPGQPYGGNTNTENLTALCEHHHRAKDAGGFTLRRTDGVYHWTTPMERNYQHSPDRPWLPAPSSPHHPDNWYVGEEHEFNERIFTSLDETDPSEPIPRPVLQPNSTEADYKLQVA